MTSTIGYWSPLTNQSLILHLYTLYGTPVTSVNGVPMSEILPATVPGYYQATLPALLGYGSYRARVYRSAALIDDGFVWVSSEPEVVVIIDDMSGRLDQPVSTLNPEISLSQLAEESAPGQYRFTAEALSQGRQVIGSGVFPAEGVLVNGFTAQAKQQLAGASISVQQPTWTAEGFHRPFVRGDSYLGPLAVGIEVLDWPGPDLTSADSIRLTARRLPALETQFQWPVSAAAVPAGFHLSLELTSGETDQPADLYVFDIEARWSDGTVHTLLGPDARLRILDDQTKAVVS